MASVSPQAFFTELTKQGASGIQAAAIVANAEFETGGGNASSNLTWYDRPDCMGLNCLTSGGYSWHGTDLPGYVSYLKSKGAFDKASGSNAKQAGQNFAQHFEICAECAPGQHQWTVRGELANLIATIAQTGNWPGATSGGGTGGLPDIGGILSNPFTALIAPWTIILKNFLNPKWWLRVGEIFLGAIMLVVGIMIVAAETESGGKLKEQGKSMAKDAAIAAVVA